MGRQVQAQKFLIQPVGIIQSGYLNYTLDPSTGLFKYQGEIVAGRYFFTKTIPLVGEEEIDTELLKSADRKVGQVIDLPPFMMIITAIRGKKAHCALKLTGEYEIEGKAIVDLSEEFIQLERIEATGNVLGYDIHLIANEI